MSSVEATRFKEIFEREIVKIMRDYKAPGMSIYITKDGEVLYQRAFGLREKKGTKPATVDTLYGISSITKSITNVAILQLHAAHKLDIHDPISKYLPVKIGYSGKPISLHHLMSHSSGIPSLHTFEFSQLNQQLYPANIPQFPFGNWDDFYFHLNDAQSEILSPPDSKYYYTNGAFALLGQVIEKVSGKSYSDYVKEKILEPLEMTRSTFFNHIARKDEDTCKGYNTEFHGEKLERSPKELLSSPFIEASGGLISSVVEMSNFLSFTSNKGVFKGKEILNESLLKEMWRTHNRHLTSKNQLYYLDATEGYGYGWRIIENYYGYTLVYHSGISGVTGGFIAFIPELQITFAQLYNVSWLPSSLMHVAFALLLGKNPENIPFFKRKKHYQNLCGTYEAYKKIVSLKITEKEGLLYLEDNNWYSKNVVPLIPKNENPDVMDFYIIHPSGRLDVQFTKHDSGELTFDYERRLMHKVSEYYGDR